jgi:hypothetical protein
MEQTDSVSDARIETALRWIREGKVPIRPKKNYTVNKEKQRVYSQKHAAKKRKTDPTFRLIGNLRSRITMALKGKNVRKAHRTIALIGCSIEALRAHLEKQFTGGMTWQNYGGAWHVDHIRPCASFDMAQPEQQRACFHFSNLQPLCKKANNAKRAKLHWPDIWGAAFK